MQFGDDVRKLVVEINDHVILPETEEDVPIRRQPQEFVLALILLT